MNTATIYASYGVPADDTWHSVPLTVTEREGWTVR